MKIRPVIGATALLGFYASQAAAQHVHGVIELGVVVDGDALAISLHAPLSDVVGFEHAPNSDEQRAAIEKAASLLSDPEQMFGIPDCRELHSRRFLGRRTCLHNAGRR